MKIGLLGGTFDPIHAGHLAIAHHARERYHLDQVQFIPCFEPPHRHNVIASAEHRLAMAHAAVEDHPYFSVSDIEIQRATISYTVDTLTALQQQFPNNQYTLILGADAFEKLDSWHCFEKILAMTDIIVISREGALNQLPEKIAPFIRKNIYFLDIPLIPISATQIRADLKQKKAVIPGMIHSVQEYIRQHHVY